MQILSDGNPSRIITKPELKAHLDAFIARYPDLRKLLIIPPDITRMNSRAGEITAYLYERLKNSCTIRILPALGTHFPMTEAEIRKMFGPSIPFEAFIAHNWKKDLVQLGKISGELVSEVSSGKLDYPIDVAVNRELIEGDYDLIVSVGQVVPHEVIGMANYTKNILVGTGGGDTINKSHFLGAVCGMEECMGKTNTPVRQVLDAGYDRFVRDRVNLAFILTVIGKEADQLVMRGLYIGDDHATFAEACELSRAVNLTTTGRPLRKCVVYLDPEEFKSTWLGNKAVYRTCLAMADGGELVVLAPALHTFGEDPDIDALIRQYGYKGTAETLQAVNDHAELSENLSAAAHLIHGTSNSRYTITYCPGDGVTQEEIEGVGYAYLPFQEAAERYQWESLKDGWNTVEGEEIFYISNPALGLWKA